MSVAIEVQVAPKYRVDGARLSRSAEATLQNHQRSGCGLTVVITDNKTVRDLNRQYRQSDAVTDVLSFPASSLPPSIESKAHYLGDIVIALPYVQEEARRRNLETGDALSMLVVHGTLHLLGYDHDAAENKRNMWAAQRAVLQALGMDAELVRRYGGVALD